MTALLEFDALLAPISDSNPCGEPVAHEVKEKLEKDRTEDDPNLPPIDPQGHRKANWNAVVDLASETLTSKSKDLLVVARLTEGLTHRYQFAGLRDGLRLMRELSERWWDHLYPQISDGNLKRRAGPYNWLDAATTKIDFPHAVRQLPLIPGDERSYSWMDCEQADKGQGEVSRAEIDKARMAAPRETFQQTAEDIAQGVQEIDRLKQFLFEKLGQELAPGFFSLRKALEDCQHRIKQALSQSSGPDGDTESNSNGEGDAGPASGGVASRAIASREEAYRQLARIAAELKKLDPHSPIPYMVGRAVELATKPLPEMMDELIRNSEALSELKRELGVKPPTESGSSSYSPSES